MPEQQQTISMPPWHLVMPKHRLPEAPVLPPWDMPQKVRFVPGFDPVALAFNLASFLALALCIGLFLYWRVSYDIRWIEATSLMLVFAPVLVMYFVQKKFQTSPENLTAHVYLNTLTRRVSIYPHGYHNVPWPSVRQEVMISFSKKELVTFCIKDGTALKVPCGDGKFAIVELTVNYNVIAYYSIYLGNTLRYTPEQIRQTLRGALEERLTELFGKNRYEVLIANWDRVKKWLATAFGGRAVLTGFEQVLNISVDDPVLDGIDLDPQSRRAAEKRSEMLQVAEGSAIYIAQGVPPRDALFTARSIVEKAKTNFTVVQADPSIKNLAVGVNAGAGVFSGGGKGNKGNKGKKGDGGEEDSLAV